MQEGAAEHLYETPLSTDQAITAYVKKGWVRVTATVRGTSQLGWWLRVSARNPKYWHPCRYANRLLASGACAHQTGISTPKYDQ